MYNIVEIKKACFIMWAEKNHAKYSMFVAMPKSRKVQILNTAISSRSKSITEVSTKMNAARVPLSKAPVLTGEQQQLEKQDHNDNHNNHHNSNKCL